METQVFTAIGPEQALLAWRQLVQLNLASWKPDVAEWLHSPEAEPVLRDLLLAVPCAGSVH